MDTAFIVSVVTVLILLATMVEAALEMLKPVLSKIQDEKWRTSANILASLALGVLLAFLFNFNLITYIPPLVIPGWAGFVIMGLLSAAGSRFWHAVLELVIKLTDMANAKAGEVIGRTNNTPPAG